MFFRVTLSYMYNCLSTNTLQYIVLKFILCIADNYKLTPQCPTHMYMYVKLHFEWHLYVIYSPIYYGFPTRSIRSRWF